MKKALCPIAAFLTGIVISVMVVANTRLGELTTNEVSMIVNQTIGVILTTLILLAGRKVETVNPPRRPSRWYMYFGGLFGVLIMIANFYSVLKVGAALAMAAAVFGQSLMGLLLDIFGLFGMKRRRVDRTKGISIAVSFLGIVIMSLSKDGTLSLPYIAMGIGAGVLTMLQMTYNSSFAAAKGAIFSARQNALSGVLATALYAFILMPQATLEGFRKLPGISLVTICLGGVLAIVVVTSSNLVIPCIPAIYSSLLMSAGQVLSSLILDDFAWSLLIGALVILVGMALNFISDWKASPQAA